MYVSRIVLNARDRQARTWLSDCHALHRLIMSGFPPVGTPSARASLGVLYRVEPVTAPPDVPVLVQSTAKPHWTPQPDAIIRIDTPRSLDKLVESMQPGNRYRFRLRANPTRRIHRRATLELDAKSTRARTEEAASIGKRVELTGEEEQIAWLKRRGEAAGFSVIATRLIPDHDVLALHVRPSGKVDGRKQGQRLTLGTVLFDGILQVTDDARLREALVTGIGPGKAFGCGLLSIAPVPGQTP